MPHPSGWIPDDEILDRRGYEERVVEALESYAKDWRREGLVLTAVELVGTYPETLLTVRVDNGTGDAAWQTTTPIWHPGNGLITSERHWRWTAEKSAAVISDDVIEDLTACS